MVCLPRTRCKSCRRSRFVDFAPGSTRCNGCVSRHLRSTNQDEQRVSAYLAGSTSDMMRGQLIETVIDGVFMLEEGHVGHMSMLGRMQDTDIKQSAVLRYATEAVIFSQLALKCKDQALALGELQQRAQQAYSHTIGQLAAVANPETDIAHRAPARSILFAIMLMGYPPVCQQFKSSSLLHQDMHIRGQYSYLNACGPSAFDWSSKEDIDFYRQLNWTLAFTKVVHSTKAVDLKLPTWKPDVAALARYGFAQETVMIPWTVSRLPDLLSQVDQILASSSPSDSSSQLHKLDRRLRQVYASVSVSKSAGDSLPSMEVVDVVNTVHDVGDFSDSIEEHRYMKSQDGLTTFYRFRPPRSPYPHEPSIQVAWVMQILVVCAMLRLRSSVQFKLEGSKRRLEEWVLGRARDLCRSIWYLSKNCGVAHARWVRVLLLVAETIFEQLGEAAVADLSWTQGCLDANRTRTDRIKRGTTASFCMVGEVLGRLPARCRWKISSKLDVT